jgi:hypothetical protein
VGDDGDLFTTAAKIGDKRCQVRSHPFSVAQMRPSRRLGPEKELSRIRLRRTRSMRGRVK